MKEIKEAIQYLERHLEHERKVISINRQNLKLKYSEHDKGVYVGLERGLEYAIDYLKFINSGG